MSIRSVLFIWAVALATSHRPALAQRTGLRVGLAAGVNVSTIKPQEGLAVEIERRTGLTAGGVATVGFGRLVTVETGIHFAQQGAKLTSTDVTEDFVYDLELAYLQIPLLLRVTAPLSSRVKPFVTLGPALGFRIQCKRTVTDQGITDSADCNARISADAERTDISLVSGVGVEAGRWMLSARYWIGREPIDAASFAPDLENRVLSLTVGFTVPVGSP